MGIISPENVNEMPSEDLSRLTLDNFKIPLSENLEGIELYGKQTKRAWLFNDPFGIVNGNLSEAAVTGLPTGSYAIVIGSADGSPRSSYSLHWNRSNPFPQSNESANLLSVSENLLQIVIYYKDDKILSNGNNLISDLEFEARRDFIVPNGYAHITSRIYSVYETGNMYTGSFSYEDFTPYFTDNALIIEIKRAGYSYIDRYYQNINGDVTSWMY